MRHNKRTLWTVLMLVLIIGLFPLPVWAGVGEPGPGPLNGDDVQQDMGLTEGLTEVVTKGRILRILDVTEEDLVNYTLIREEMAVEVISGPYKGERFITENVHDPTMPYRIDVGEGDAVVLFLLVDESGEIQEGYISERARDRSLVVLLVFFAGLMILVGGFKGFRALLALAITMGAIVWGLLPGILAGYSPVLLTIGIAVPVILVTIPLISGWNAKAVAAIAGTLGGVMAAGLLAWIVSVTAGLTGLSMEEASMLTYIPQAVDLDFRGLLFATNILGSLGAVMDVSVSVSSSMWEIKRHNPRIRPAKLVESGFNVGRDIIGTMANTLILAYTGSSLYLFLLFQAYEMSLFEIVNIDAMATEIVRALAGSIGLVLTIPITAMAAAYVFGRRGLRIRRRTSGAESGE